MAEEEGRPADLERLRPLPRISVHAFCASEQLHRVMERLGQDRRMAKVNLRITSGGTDAAANMFSAAPTPNLIILKRMQSRATARRTRAAGGSLRSLPPASSSLAGTTTSCSTRDDPERHFRILVGPVSMRICSVPSPRSSSIPMRSARPFYRFHRRKGRRWFLYHCHNCAFGFLAVCDETIWRIWIWPMAPPISISIRIRRRALLRRSMRPRGWTRFFSTVF